MGSNINFKNFGTDPPPANIRPPGNDQLTRQPSVYSLTFEEFQNSMGKDFGSMNMDELIKNIWSAEESQSIAPASGAGGGGQDGNGVPGGFLQRQGSLTLPRTLSQKTVDEVWKDLSKEYSTGKDGGIATGGPAVPQRQQTLGEMTLEEFLFRAGVVREDAQFTGKPNGGALFGELPRAGNNAGFGFGFPQPGKAANLMGMRNLEGGNLNPMQPLNMPVNANGIRANQQHATQPQAHQPQILPKQPVLPFTQQIPSPNSGHNQGFRGGLMGIPDPVMTNNLVQGGALQGGGMRMVGLGAGTVGMPTGSPANPVSSDGMGRSNGDTSSVSPVPYVFNGGTRGRKCNSAVEKVVERRQRRMIKNRESAARSRARKQAYTMELETEIAKLKEENDELRKKQAEIMEIQKNQVMEMMNMQRGAKKRCLRRTQTGPW
ncbi:BZIP domain-containing protein [Psidium guajava]|nr:BZIP domain-containing protein [Psidium guajava]